MKKVYTLGFFFLAALVFFAANKKSTNNFEGFVKGTPEIKSMNRLAFGPEGILFIGDTKGAAIYAIETSDLDNLEKEISL